MNSCSSSSPISSFRRRFNLNLRLDCFLLNNFLINYTFWNSLGTNPVVSIRLSEILKDSMLQPTTTSSSFRMLPRCDLHQNSCVMSSSGVTVTQQCTIFCSLFMILVVLCDHAVLQMLKPLSDWFYKCPFWFLFLVLVEVVELMSSMPLSFNRITLCQSRSTFNTMYLLSCERPKTGTILSFNSKYLSLNKSSLFMLSGLIKCMQVVTLQQMYMPTLMPSFLQVLLSIATNSSLFTGAMLMEKFVLYFYSLFCSF